MQHHKKGFTLVELAVVMMIIGLLIGGVLKGQELMQNSRITATISQVRAYEAAVTTFRDKYDALPGDMRNAARRIPGCGGLATCNPAAATAGNSMVGNQTWNPAGANWVMQTGAAAALVANANGETVLFWAHLMGADLISGVTNSALTGGAAIWGETHPAAKIAGGFVVGHGNGNRPPGAPAGITGPSGLVLALARSPRVALSTAAGTQVLYPARAAQIDRKIDDGRPGSGDVMAYGRAASCFSLSGTARIYSERVASTDCGLIFKLGD